MFQLNIEEWTNLKSQIVTSSWSILQTTSIKKKRKP